MKNWVEKITWKNGENYSYKNFMIVSVEFHKQS